MKQPKQSRKEQFTHAILHTFGTTKGSEILAGLNEKRLTGIRINQRSEISENIVQRLQSHHIPLTPVPWSPHVYTTTATTRQLTDTIEYTDGLFYIQSLSSMIPVLALNPQPGEVVLDLAAAPGSKTSQIARLMNNEGSIVANDISPTRLFKLQAVLKLQHVENVTITSVPGQRIWQKYPEYFDKVLLDAPCSMEGRIDLNAENSLSHWSLKKVRELSYLQKMLLRSAISATKIGGTIVYSTCTINTDENEEVVDWILKKMGDAVTLESIEVPHLTLQPGYIPESKHLDPRITHTARLYPDQNWEGFFIAKLKKTASTLP